MTEQVLQNLRESTEQTAAYKTASESGHYLESKRFTQVNVIAIYKSS